jgi:ribosomal protein L9
MIIQYIADHESGKKGEIKEVGEHFGKYLILRSKAVKYVEKEVKEVLETKEEKAPRKTKEK